MKKVLINFCLGAATLVFIIMVAELGVRVVHFFKYGRPLFFSVKGPRQPMYLEKKLGWRTTEDYFSQRVLADAAGKPYRVLATTDKHGFRFFGNPQSAKIKIFIIGDSYTQAMEISNDKTYYGVMSKQLVNAELFVYGCGGYGTLQEYLIIDEYIDLIKPDILLIQLCTNDFMNNSYELEYASWNNNYTRRPYLDAQGNIFYKNPQRLGFLPDILMEKSRLTIYCYDKISRLMTRINKDSIRLRITSDAFIQREFSRSIRTTGTILGMIKQRAPGVEIIAFCVDSGQPFYAEMKKLVKINGFQLIEGVPQAIQEAEQQGLVTRVADRSHWNELGHRLAGEKILAYFQEHRMINQSSRAWEGNPSAKNSAQSSGQTFIDGHR